jgi:cation diffusion facilitator family transporter
MVKEKDYTNKKTRIICGIFTGIFGLIINLILFVVKFKVGFYANSITIMSDALNSLSDLGSCFVTILGFLMALRPADKEHPYKYSKHEFIFGVIISLTMVLIGGVFAKISYDRMYYPEIVLLNLNTFRVLMISIIIKIFQMLVYWRIAKKMEPSIISSSTKAVRNDILISSFALLSLMFMKKIRLNLDPFAGLVVAMLVIYTSPRSTREYADTLLGSPEEIELVGKIKEIFLSHEEILEVKDVRVHTYGSDATFAMVEANVDTLMTILEAFKLSSVIEEEVENKLGFKLTIYIEPLELEKKLVKDIYKRTKIALKEVDSDLRFHDFIASSKNHKIYIEFEALVPFGKKYEIEQLEELMRKVYKKDENDKYEYDFSLNVDRPICWIFRRIYEKMYYCGV